MPQIPVLGGTQAEPLAEGGPCGRTGDLRPAASGATMYLCKVDTLQERNSILKLTEARQPQCSSWVRFLLSSLPHPTVRSQEVISVGEAKLLRGQGDGKVQWRRSSCHRSHWGRGREERGGGRRFREWLVFIFAREAYLMIFPQIDKQTRDGHTEHTCVFWNNPYPQIQDAACCHNHPANCPGYG